MKEYFKEALSADTNIWVSPNGNDEVNNGYFESPFRTIEKAVAAITTSRLTVILMPGAYTITTDIDITVNGTKIIGLGGVAITATAVTTYAFKTVFGAASGTKSVTFENFSLNHGAKVGIQLQNTGATAKVNCYINDVVFDATSASYSSVDVDHAVTTQAIRCYMNRCTTEGKIDWVAGNDADRLRFNYGNLRGGLVTDAGNYDAEFLVAWSTFLLNGVTGGHSNQRAIFVASVSETDADPNVYLEAVSTDVETQTAQIIAFDAP